MYFAETLPTNVSFYEEDLWYTQEMETVEWKQLFAEFAPFISFTDRITLLEIAGSDGVSPALLLSAAVYYKNEKKSSFKHHVKYMSAKLADAFFNSTNRTTNQREKENDAAHTISLFVNKDPKQLNELIAILRTVKTEAAKYQKTPNEATFISNQIKRSDGQETFIRFPFKTNECWMMSATHHSNEQCSSRFCPKSAIDLAPNLFMGFGHDFSYFESQGEVVASHSGYVFVHSPCKLQVKSEKLTTFYSHIAITRKTGEYVRVGERLGFIQIESSLSNCNCEVAAGRTECSTGPHLHWEVRDPSNRALDLHGMEVSGFKIYTGTESYDFGCPPENCHNNMTLEEIERSCSTVFLRIVDNVTFCPSVQGANWGKYFITNIATVYIYTNYIKHLVYHKLISISSFFDIQIGGGYSHGSNIVNKPPVAQLPINGHTGK